MSNMSYCAFENTLGAISQLNGMLIESINNNETRQDFEADMSSYELAAFRKIAVVARGFLELMAELEQSGFDSDVEVFND